MKYAGLGDRPARAVQSAITSTADIPPALASAQAPSFHGGHGPGGHGHGDGHGHSVGHRGGHHDDGHSHGHHHGVHQKQFSAALQLAKAGLPSFFCAGDKRPTCPHGFKDATCDPAALQELWRKHPGPLVGVPTGSASGIFVVDVDGPKHESAEEWLERHAAYLPDTRHHRTQSGGLHLLFKHQGLACSVSRLARGVDTRGEGGYIIWWPATLQADHYRAPLADLPEWMAEKLAPPPTQLITTIERPECDGPPDLRLKGIIETVVLARKGERNKLTFWGACTIRSMLVKGELDAADAASAYAALIQASRHTGLSEREITRTIASALRAS